MLKFSLKDRYGVLLLAAAALAVLPVYWHPTLWIKAPTYAYLFVLDVTQSMNVRDIEDDKRSRLSAAKDAVAAALRQLPCGSRAAVALFADNETVVLFEPLEVCAHYAAMEKVVEGVNWRYAWSGNSHIDMGLASAMKEAKERGLKVVFVSDGHQTPPQDGFRLTAIHARRGVSGIIVGIGGDQPRPVPRLDENDAVVGYWTPEEALRQGFNPNLLAATHGLERLSLLGSDAEAVREHLSAHDADALRQLAEAARMTYLRFASAGAFARVVDAPALADFNDAPRDLRAVFGMIALALFLAGWLKRE